MGRVGKLTGEEIRVLSKANQVLEIIEDILEKFNFTFCIEGENMFLKSADGRHLFRLADVSQGGSDRRFNSLIELPRTIDSQELVPERLSGEDLRNCNFKRGK